MLFLRNDFTIPNGVVRINNRVCLFAGSAMADQAAADPEVQQFLMMEQQKAQFQSQVHRLVDTCWDRCIDKPRDKLDSRAETCLSNCVERFVDTSIQITGRFQQMLQRSVQQ